MNKINRKLIMLSVGLVILVTTNMFTPITAEKLPVIEIEDVEDTFIPSTYQNEWSYYLLPQETMLDHPIKYVGEDTNFQYTDVDASGNEYDAYTTAITEDTELSSGTLVKADSRTSNQPFLENSETMPRAVRLSQEADPEFIMQVKEPMNLHMDFSFTFLAEKDEQYYAMLESPDPFYLDIEVHDCDAIGEVFMQSASPIYTPVESKMMTYPFVPIFANVSVQNFTLSFDSTTLVTLTPHKVNLPTQKLEVGELYTDVIIQGSLDPEDKNYDLISNKSNAFSINAFEFNLIENHYYKIYVDIVDYLDIENCQSESKTFLTGDPLAFNVVSGSLNENGLMFQALKNDTVTLIHFIAGLADEKYTIYCREIPAPETEIIPLEFDVPLSLDPNQLYSFELDNPTLLALNSTDPGSFDLLFYRVDDDGGYSYITNEAFFNIEAGNIVGDIVGDIGNNWRYIPAGIYYVLSDSVSTGELIQFNAVKVNVLSSGFTHFTLTENSFHAYEIPLSINRYNFVNLSTTDHNNESYRIEYSMINKFNDGIGSSTDNLWLGNQQSGGIWQAFPDNNTNIEQYLPTRSHDVPVIILRAFEAENVTLDPIDNFSAQITLSKSVQSGFYPTVNLAAANIGDGDFIYTSTITGSETITINDDKSSAVNHIYGIPANVDADSIYNVTIRLIGNYSTGGSLNATIDNIYHHCENLRNLAIFNSASTVSGETEENQTLLILTSAEIIYFYVDIVRANPSYIANATMEIILDKLDIEPLDFDIELSDYQWTEDRLDGEIRNRKLLLTWMNKPKGIPSFELFTTLGSLLFMSTIIILIRKQRQ